MHFAGTVDKDCHEREGHETYEVHSASHGGLVGAGGARMGMSHNEALMGGQAHTTTPHLAMGHGQLSPGPGSQYRSLLPPGSDHEQQHYSSGGGETRPSVIESSQPLIIECT